MNICVTEKEGRVCVCDGFCRSVGGSLFDRCVTAQEGGAQSIQGGACV